MRLLPPGTPLLLSPLICIRFALTQLPLKCIATLSALIQQMKRHCVRNEGFRQWAAIGLMLVSDGVWG